MDEDKIQFNDNEMLTLIEQLLLDKIRDVYEDITTTATEKRTEREKYIKQFIEEYMKKSTLSKEEIMALVEKIIDKTRWIQEIEELDKEERR